MSTVALDIHWTPDPSVFRDAILEVDAALAHPEIALALAAQEVSSDIRERFLSQTAPDGTPWKEWSENYEPIAIAYPNIAILRRTDELFEAATDTNAMIVSGDTLFFDLGSLPEYGEWHQEGRQRIKGGNLPARPFLGLSDEGRATIFAVFGEWFQNAIQLFHTSTGRIGMRHAMTGIHPTTGKFGFIPRRTPLPTLRRI